MIDNMDEPTLTLLSCGAGVQSSTLALMAISGELPGLDAALFADTGWEPRRVYRVVDELEKALAAANIPLHRVSAGNLRDDSINPEHRYASVPYYTLNTIPTQEPIKSSGVECPACAGSGWAGGGLRDDMRAAAWLEHFTEEQQGALEEIHGTDKYGACPKCQVPGGRPGVHYRAWYTVKARQEGMGRRQCTSEYKISPINRKVRELLGAAPPDFRHVPRGRVAEQWIGFSTDEAHRVSDKEDGEDPRRRGVLYVRKRYPLLELGMSRTDCETYLRAQGWGHVAKSACVGCPFHGNRQWRELRDTCDCGHPRGSHYDRFGDLTPEGGQGRCSLCACEGFNAPEWDDAVAFDTEIRKGGGRGVTLDGEAFLHRSRLPLSIAPIDRSTIKERQSAQSDIFDEIEDGDADGCSPYGCRSGAPA